MFGHQDDQQALNDAAGAPAPADDHWQSDQPADQKPADTAAPEPSADQPAVHPTALLEPSSDNLLMIKQQALGQLQPLVSQLDQAPEEKFRTLMMMIQASDDQSLIKSAYEAASAIGDEKQKAQALLDIVNEINYFTHPHNDK